MDVYPESLELDRNQYLWDVTSFEFGELCSCSCKLLSSILYWKQYNSKCVES